MAMYPIWINDGIAPKPEVRIFYEIASNGTFLHKQNLLGESVVPVDEISVLEKSAPSFKSSLPVIPSEAVCSMVRFFAWITFNLNTEAIMLLWWNEETKSYRFTVPVQKVSYASIDYQNVSNPGHLLVGTFHSHGRISASHSDRDLKDERFGDGIHGTFGGFSSRSEVFEISLQASINNSRFALNPGNFLEGIKRYCPPEPGKEEEEKEEGAEAIYMHPECGRGWLGFKKDPSPYSLRYVLVEEQLCPIGYRPGNGILSKISRLHFWPGRPDHKGVRE